MSDINLDKNIAAKLAASMTGDAVELPYNVVYVWTINGQASYKAQGGALYFGGWASKKEDLDATAEAQGLSVPAGWKQVTIASRDGNEFEAYTSRSVIVAPFGKRLSWLKDGKRSPDYSEGARRHLQVLCYMAEKQGDRDPLRPWGPVVLTAKGYQARNLLDSFARWNKALQAAIHAHARGVPAWCFYMGVGTYDKERVSVNVGKPGAQSPITPVGAYLPTKEIDKSFLERLFVGNEVAAIMSDLQDQSVDWLNAWKSESDEGGNGHAVGIDDAPFSEGYDVNPENEIPF